MTRTYYDILGVPTDASTDEIEAAYRERLVETHPDVSDDEDASEATMELIQARDVLTDADERARYDRFGHEAYVARATGSPGDVGETATADDTGSASEPEAHSDGASGNETRGTDAAAADAGTEYGWGPNGWGPTDEADVGVDGVDWGETDRARQRQQRAREEREWHTYESDAPYSVGGDDRRIRAMRIAPNSQSVVLLLATFVLYPVFLAAAFFPSFPIAVNVVLAGCTVLVVAYLQSMPAVGMVVFGTWSLLLPALLVFLGVDLGSLLAVGLMLGVVLPFGFSALTRSVVRT